jgi:hypothetical protein
MRECWVERETMAFKRAALMRGAQVAVAALSVAALAGCAHGDSSGRAVAGHVRPQDQATIGVNAYLWRASLDTLAFMPLASADPYGGLIITDWYANPDKPDERFKCTVYILDSRLRADALNVTVYKQIRDASGAWVDSVVSDQTPADIENAILTRARQLRLSNING